MNEFNSRPRAKTHAEVAMYDKSDKEGTEEGINSREDLMLPNDPNPYAGRKENPYEIGPY